MAGEQFLRLDELAASLAGSAADFVGVLLVENGNRLRLTAAADARIEMQPIVDHMRGQLVFRPSMEQRALAMLRSGEPIVENDVAIERIVMQAWSYLEDDLRKLDPRAITVIPLSSNGELIGALLFYRCKAQWPFSPDEVNELREVGRDLVVSIERLRTLERERRLAESTQIEMLPPPERLPRVAGMSLSIYYRPSSKESEVGGDWYDALRLSDGTIFVSVGDVVGRGVKAAGTMGELRQALAAAAQDETDPARILDAVDEQMRALDPQLAATAFAAIIDAKHGTLRYAGGGHPPALLRRNNGLAELRSTGLPIGLRDQDEPQRSRETSLAGVRFLLLYTDGLIGARKDVLAGQRRVEQMASTQAILFVRNPANSCAMPARRRKWKTTRPS
jgi:hypothetical protein